MRSIGINLGRRINKGLLQFQAARPATFGLEMHLVKMHEMISNFDPSIVVVDPMTGLIDSGTQAETRSMLLRLIDFLKQKQIAALCRGTDCKIVAGVRQSEADLRRAPRRNVQN